MASSRIVSPRCPLVQPGPAAPGSAPSPAQFRRARLSRQSSAPLQHGHASPPKNRTQSFLTNLPLFRELSAEEIDRIAAGTTERHVDRGSVVASKGEPVDGLHVVVYGQVKLSLSTPQGDEKVVEMIGPGVLVRRGAHVPGQAVHRDGHRPRGLAAAATCGKETVLDGIERDRTFALRMLAGMSRKLHSLMSDLEAVTLKTGPRAGHRLPDAAGGRRRRRETTLLGVAARQQGDRRLAPQPDPRALLAHPARAGRGRPDRGRRPRHPHRRSCAPAPDARRAAGRLRPPRRGGQPGRAPRRYCWGVPAPT